jgi:hypothetical protein
MFFVPVVGLLKKKCTNGESVAKPLDGFIFDAEKVLNLWKRWKRVGFCKRNYRC